MSISTVFRSRVTRIGLPLATAGLLGAAVASGAVASTPTARSTDSGGRTSVTMAATGVTVANGHLVDGTGRTVYLWAGDPMGKSNCDGACATVWPPVQTTGTPAAGSSVDPSMLSTIKRADGTSQLAYAGHALYYFVADRTPGKAIGQGSDDFGAKWWEVNPAGQAITGGSSTAPSMTGPGISY